MTVISHDVNREWADLVADIGRISNRLGTCILEMPPSTRSRVVSHFQ